MTAPSTLMMLLVAAALLAGCNGDPHDPGEPNAGAAAATSLVSS